MNTASPQFIRLSDATNLTARVTADEGDRFAMLFRQAISKLPRGAIDLIYRHWGAISATNPHISLGWERRWTGQRRVR